MKNDVSMNTDKTAICYLAKVVQCNSGRVKAMLPSL